MDEECVEELGKPISSLKVTELRDELTRRALIRTGNKKELIDRLRTAILKSSQLSSSQLASQNSSKGDQQSSNEQPISDNAPSEQAVDLSGAIDLTAAVDLTSSDKSARQQPQSSTIIDTIPQNEPALTQQPNLENQNLSGNHQTQNYESVQDEVSSKIQDEYVESAQYDEQEKNNQKIKSDEQNRIDEQAQSVEQISENADQAPVEKSTKKLIPASRVTQDGKADESIPSKAVVSDKEQVYSEEPQIIDSQPVSTDKPLSSDEPPSQDEQQMSTDESQPPVDEQVSTNDQISRDKKQSSARQQNSDEIQKEETSADTLDARENTNQTTFSLKRGNSDLRSNSSSGSKEKRRKWSSKASDNTQGVDSPQTMVLSGGISSQRLQELIEVKPMEIDSSKNDNKAAVENAGTSTTQESKSRSDEIEEGQLADTSGDSKSLECDVEQQDKSVEKEVVDQKIPDDSKATKTQPQKQDKQQDSTIVEPVREPTNLLLIQNLVRPFTLPQLKEVLMKHGPLIEEKFWIDKVKSKCCVMYESVEIAQLTKESLNGQQWPSSNPKTLKVTYTDEETVVKYQKLDLNKVEGKSVSRDLNENGNNNNSDQTTNKSITNRLGNRLEDGEAGGDNAKKRLGDMVPCEMSTKSSSINREGDNTQPQELDDLFKKTKSVPHLFWLPLTEDQADSRQIEREERFKKKALALKSRRSPPPRRRSPPPRKRSPPPRTRSPARHRSSPRNRSRSRSPLPRRSPPRRRPSPLLRRRSPMTARRSPAPLLRSPGPVGRSPSRRSPGPMRRSPGPMRRSPGLIRRSPALLRRSPGPGRRSPGLIRRSPGPGRRSPTLLRRSPRPMGRSPRPVGRSPRPIGRSPGPIRRSPVLMRRSPGPMRRSPGLVRRSPGLNRRSPGRRSPLLVRRSPAPIRGSSPARRSPPRKRSPMARRRSPPRHMSPSRNSGYGPDAPRRPQRLDRY